MWRPNAAWRRLEDELIRSAPPDLQEAFRTVEALLEEAVALGVWPPEDPLEGIEVDLRVAKIVNVPVDPGLHGKTAR